MLKLKIDKDYYDEGTSMYDKETVSFEPGVTVLVGCNGSGKTTLLRQIEIICKEKNIPIISFDNYRNGGKEMMQMNMLYGDMSGVINNYMSSEGERISNAILEHAKKIGQLVRQHRDAEKIVILFDAVDSGFSADNIVELKKQLFDVIIDECHRSDIEPYIIVAGNSYEMAANERCIDVCRLTSFVPKSYQRWRKVIMNTRKKKNHRYGWDEFEYGE